jgi:quercetin dioxygenase-like cupin family protein
MYSNHCGAPDRRCAADQKEQPSDMTELVHRPVVISDSDTQTAVWFLGALVRTRLDSDSSDDVLAVLDHQGRSGYNSPLHRHLHDEETFVVLDGRVQFTADGEDHVAVAGSAVLVPRRTVHGFVVTSPSARFLTLHTPGGFDRFTNRVGFPARGPVDADASAPLDAPVPSPEDLTRIAAEYGIEIVGPPPAPRMV